MVTPFTDEESKHWVKELFDFLNQLDISPEKVFGRTFRVNEVHPLARWILAWESYIASGSTHSFAEIRFTLLASEIHDLRSCPGLDERVVKLFTGSESDFWATLHEISTASKYARLGLEVAFIPEGQQKTPDFTLNGSVEVECKSRERDSAEVVLQRSVCGQVLDTLSELVSNRSDGVGILADLRLQSDPPGGWYREISTSVQSLLRADTDLSVVSQTPTSAYRLKRFPACVISGPDLRDPSFYAAGSDLSRWRGQVIPHWGQGSVQFKNYAQVSVKKIGESETWKLGNALRKATRQLGGNVPGIIEIEVTPEVGRLFSGPYAEEMTGAVREVLRNHRRVSVIRMTAWHERVVQGQMRVGNFAIEFPNEGARNPLPNWAIPSLINPSSAEFDSWMEGNSGD